MSTPPRPTWVYHITHLDNLPSILMDGALICKVQADLRGLRLVNIAYETVQGSRAVRTVSCGPGGTLHDYVPFYFCPRSPMLYALHGRFVAGYAGGQEEIVHLVTSAENIASAGLAYVFSDGHGIKQMTQFFSDLRDLERLDWKVIQSWSWADQPDDPDRKRRKQAEFLVHGRVPWSLITSLGVHSQEVADRFIRLLASTTAAQGSPRPVVKVEKKWYY